MDLSDHYDNYVPTYSQFGVVPLYIDSSRNYVINNAARAHARCGWQKGQEIAGGVDGYLSLPKYCISGNKSGSASNPAPTPKSRPQCNE